VKVQGACPHCGQRSLECDGLGFVFCTRVRCVDPYAASDLLRAFAGVGQVERLPFEDVA
jgi:hypothetical protein